MTCLAVKPHAQRTSQVDIVNPQVGDLLCPRATVIEKHEERSVTERQGAMFRQGGKQLVDLVTLQVTGFWRRRSLCGNRFHPLGFGEHFGVMHGEITVECTKRSEPLISRADLVPAYAFDHTQELQHSLGR